jgi:hypothetical protein
MSYLSHIKRTSLNKECRWIVKYNNSGLIREVKQVYNPSEYHAMNKHKGKDARPLHTKSALINILENDRHRRSKN